MRDKLHNKKNPRGRHRNADGDYLLTGKLYCGKCKSHMVGLSGTSKTSALHYYYACQKKRLERACDKKAVRRDWIEREVAAAIKEKFLNDETVAWMADALVEYAKDFEENSDVEILETQFADNKRAIKNLMTAIEQGIITATTRERLQELETERETLNNALVVERASIFKFNRDDVISAIELFRDGSVDDKEYQAELFKSFLIAVYLYDDEIEIVFDFKGEQDKVRVPFSTDDGGGGKPPTADNIRVRIGSILSHHVVADFAKFAATFLSPLTRSVAPPLARQPLRWVAARFAAATKCGRCFRIRRDISFKTSESA